MPTKRLSRRTVLRGALATGAAVSVPLPLLDIMLNGNGNALAAGTALPRRYITWFFGNGILPPLWNPTATGSGSAWSISSELMPIAAFKSWMTVISGLSQKVGNASPHPMGSAACTTGASVSNNSAMTMSIDQIVAGRQQGRQLPLARGRLHDATPDGPENTLHTSRTAGTTRRTIPEFDPDKFFHPALHRNGGRHHRQFRHRSPRSTREEEHPRLVLADGAELTSLLGAADKTRLSDHLDAIRQIEIGPPPRVDAQHHRQSRPTRRRRG